MPRRIEIPLAVAMLACLQHAAAQSYFDDIGWTDLVAKLGSATPDGTGVTLSVIEADTNGADDGAAYQIDSSLEQFAGKNITYETSGGLISAHATYLVGLNIFGNGTSIASGITTIQNRSADDWLSSVMRRGSAISPPATVTADVQNHSWIGSFGNTQTDTEVLRRFDNSIATSDYVAVVGLNNGVGSVPSLLGSSYNAIVVGTSGGSHSYGLTTIDGTNRSKPDVVSPKGTTSEATATVSSAAAVLIEAAGGSSNPGAHAVVVKSVIMAGATRMGETEFNWTADRDNGVNSVVGAGELNISRSYDIMASGEKSSGVDLGTSGSMGWDYGAVTSNSTQTYFFEVPQAGYTDYGIVLTWMRVTSASPTWLNPSSTLSDLDLTFYNASGTSVGTLILSGYDNSRDTSVSGDVNNVEMIALPSLAPGDYAIRVTSASSSATAFGLAWGGTLAPAAVPEPGTIALLALGGLTLVPAMRRASRRKNS